MSAGATTSVATQRVHRRRKARAARLEVVPGTSGDHQAVWYLLKEQFPGLGRPRFKASLEDPFYQPHDRLLVKSNGQIVGHVLLRHRQMQFGPLALAAGWLTGLVIKPEFRGRGMGSRLVEVAEDHLRQAGTLLGLLQTGSPHFFRRSDWALCGRHRQSHADARAVLSELPDHRLKRRKKQRLQIRPFRRWELGALARIYSQNLPGSYGLSVRNEDYWQWLLRCRVFDQIYVALDGPGLQELEETSTRIVGYSVARGEQIVELQSARQSRSKAQAELIGRCCGDAIEHDRYGVTLRAPGNESLHELFQAAGGTHHNHVARHGRVYMARLLDPPALLGRLGSQLHSRADGAHLPRPLELGLLVDGKKIQVELAPGMVRVVTGRIGRSYLRMNVADFTRLVLGQLRWDVALADGRLAASTALADKAGRALFPSLPLCYPPLDELTM